LFRGEFFRELTRVMKTKFPEKFTIRVLYDIFQLGIRAILAQSATVPPIDMTFTLLQSQFVANKEKKATFTRPFDYAGREWTVTVQHKIAPYKHPALGDKPQMVYFINIRLPNDGYMYSRTYAVDGILDDDVLLNEENQEALAFADGVAQILSEFNANFEPTAIRTTYNGLRGRVEIKFFDAKNRKCFCVGYEYGHHNAEARREGDESDAHTRFESLLAAHFKPKGK